MYLQTYMKQTMRISMIWINAREKLGEHERNVCGTQNEFECFSTEVLSDQLNNDKFSEYKVNLVLLL